VTSRADARGWGSGWPHNNASKCTTITAARSGVSLMVRREIAPLVKFCIDEVERRGYLYDHGPMDPVDDWSFVNRPIRGTSIPSNHSWGLAIDLDASLYPQGQRKARPPQWVDDIWRKYRFDNGAPWANPDPMHYEFNGTPNDAKFLVDSLTAHAVEDTPPPMPPSAPAPLPDPEDIMHVVNLAYTNRTERWFVLPDRGRVLAYNLNLTTGEADALASGFGQRTVTGDRPCDQVKSFWREISWTQFTTLRAAAL
jgi:hypothetical protein